MSYFVKFLIGLSSAVLTRTRVRIENTEHYSRYVPGSVSRILLGKGGQCYGLGLVA